jgi:hypothetical protein
MQWSISICYMEWGRVPLVRLGCWKFSKTCYVTILSQRERTVSKIDTLCPWGLCSKTETPSKGQMGVQEFVQFTRAEHLSLSVQSQVVWTWRWRKSIPELTRESSAHTVMPILPGASSRQQDMGGRACTTQFSRNLTNASKDQMRAVPEVWPKTYECSGLLLSLWYRCRCISWAWQAIRG